MKKKSPIDKFLSKEKLKKIKIFSSNSGKFKDSPLFNLLNKEKLNKTVKSLQKKEFLQKSAIALAVLVVLVNLPNDKEKKEEVVDNNNTIENIIQTKEIENVKIESLELDLINNNLIVNEKEIKDKAKEELKTITKEELFNLNWDFRTPAPKFEKYYTTEYSNSLPTKEYINEVEKFYGIPKNTLYYMGFKESAFDLSAKNERTNAQGYSGFLPSTAKEYNLINDKHNFLELRNGYATVDASARYILWLNSYVNGSKADIYDNKKDKSGHDNLDYALAAYNAGPSKVVKFLGKGKQIRHIPNYKETKNYIKDIKMLLEGRGYIVQKNDTLEKISDQFNIDRKLIIRNNFQLSSNQNLKYDTVLNIENNPDVPIEITIEKGFSISKIARKTGNTMEDLLAYNDLEESSLLFIGNKIKLPPIDRVEATQKKTIKTKRNTI